MQIELALRRHRGTSQQHAGAVFRRSRNLCSKQFKEVKRMAPNVPLIQVDFESLSCRGGWCCLKG